MSSRVYLKHTVSNTQPGTAQIGDEWLNSSTNRMYQFLSVSGATPQWIEIPVAITPNTFSMTNLAVSGGTTTAGNTTTLALSTTNLAETVSLVPLAITTLLNYNVTTQTVYYVTANSTGNFTVNIRASDTTTLNSILNIGQSVTVALFVTNGSTPYYVSAVQVDGASPASIKWQGGTAPSAGNASATDSYTFSVIKTAASTYTVLAAQTKFA